MQKILQTQVDFQGFETSERGSKSNRKRAGAASSDNMELVMPKNTRFQQQDKQLQMSPKVLETWINDTLTDAEHLDIPGVIVKPEHKNPISRYGIDRMAFSNAGIPNDLVDRVYRALFVYSVGFYELINKCLAHTNSKYTLVTNVWKVFAILLEYCCRTDYRMLISEISKEHKTELDKLDKDFQAKFREQADHEKILRDTNETLTKYAEELERERANEKQLRQKLEEDYAQNTKNHEEEVQLRLKFESKLNNMHSAHRELESKYKTALIELANANKQSKITQIQNSDLLNEVAMLRKIIVENNAKMALDFEEIGSGKRELQIKLKQLKDVEVRCEKTVEELDQTRFNFQDLQKVSTEMKLQVDVKQSSIDGLNAQIKHLMIELKETRDLQKIYQDKCGILINQLAETNQELNSNKLQMIGYTQTQEEKDEKINSLKLDLGIYKVRSEELHIQLGTLKIQHEKVKEHLSTLQKTYDDIVEKLHRMNKARHDLETKLTDELERNRSLNDIVRLKEDTIIRRQSDLEEMDRKVIDLERALESLEIKKQGIERQSELQKKQLGDQITALGEVNRQERETRDLWVERFEKEQKEHTKTQADLMQAKSELKDEILNVKHGEIKLNTSNRQIQLLQEQQIKFQHQINESLSKAENLDRELSTQKEILKQQEISKREYIERLKQELDQVEKKWYDIVDQNCMIGEDYRSQAFQLIHEIANLNQTINLRDTAIQQQEESITEFRMQLQKAQEQHENLEMQGEDLLTQLEIKNERINFLELNFAQHNETLENMTENLNQAILENAQLKQALYSDKLDAETQTTIGADFFIRKPGSSHKDSNDKSDVNSQKVQSKFAQGSFKNKKTIRAGTVGKSEDDPLSENMMSQERIKPPMSERANHINKKNSVGESARKVSVPTTGQLEKGVSFNDGSNELKGTIEDLSDQVPPVTKHSQISYKKSSTVRNSDTANGQIRNVIKEEPLEEADGGRNSVFQHDLRKQNTQILPQLRTQNSSDIKKTPDSNLPLTARKSANATPRQLQQNSELPPLDHLPKQLNSFVGEVISPRVRNENLSTLKSQHNDEQKSNLKQLSNNSRNQQISQASAKKLSVFEQAPTQHLENIQTRIPLPVAQEPRHLSNLSIHESVDSLTQDISIKEGRQTVLKETSSQSRNSRPSASNVKTPTNLQTSVQQFGEINMQSLVQHTHNFEDQIRQAEIARLQEQSQRVITDRSNIRKLIKLKASME